MCKAQQNEETVGWDTYDQLGKKLQGSYLRLLQRIA